MPPLPENSHLYSRLRISAILIASLCVAALIFSRLTARDFMGGVSGEATSIHRFFDSAEPEPAPFLRADSAEPATLSPLHVALPAAWPRLSQGSDHNGSGEKGSGFDGSELDGSDEPNKPAVVFDTNPTVIHHQKSATAYHQGVHHVIHGRLDTALEIFERLSNQYREQGVWGEWMVVAGYLGLIHREGRRFDVAERLAGEMAEVANRHLSPSDPRQAIPHLLNAHLAVEEFDLERALQQAEQAVQSVGNSIGLEELRVRSWAVLGYVYDVRGDYRKAIEAYRRGMESTLQIESRETRLYMLTRVNNNLGVALRKSGKYEEAMEQYRLNRGYLLQLYDEDHPEVARNLNNIGSILFRSGDILSAAGHFIQAANLFEEHYGRDHKTVAAAYNNAGTALLKIEDHDEALRYLKRALGIKIRLLGEEHLETGIGYSNLASAYAMQGELKMALGHYDRSLRIREQGLGPGHPGLIRPLLSRGRHHIRMGSGDLAIADLERVIEVAQERLEPGHPDLAEAWIERGRAHQMTSQNDEAATAIQRALGVLVESFDDMDLFANPEQLNVPHQRLLLTALTLKADVMLEMGRSRDDLELVTLAADTYRISVDLVEALQSGFRHEVSKLNLFQEFYDIFEGALTANWLLYQQKGDQRHVEEAFSILERGKSRIASELLHRSKLRTEGGIPEEVRREEQKMKREIAYRHQRLLLEKKRGDERDERRYLELQNDLIRAHRQLLDWEEEMEVVYPQLGRMTGRGDLPDLDQVQTSLLEEGQIALNYLVGSENSFLLLISRERVHLSKLPASHHIAPRVEELLTAIRNQDYTGFSTLSYQLYEMVLKPVEGILSGYEELLVVADDLLHYLPFELLLTQPASDHDATRWSYLLHDLRVSYTPSLDVYGKRERAQSVQRDRLLAVAPYAESSSELKHSGGGPGGSDSAGPPLPALPMSGYEAEESARIFEQSGRSLIPFRRGRSAVLLMNDEASLERVAEHPLESYGYIHLATHATINSAFPELSGIRFADDGSDQQTLYLGDVANMSFNTELMVLSACDTGLGPLARGEGMIGFSRAFIQSGVRNLLVSLWKVSDRPTSELMVTFYEEMMAGEGRSEALRRAKLSLIENPATAFPAYWAPFILIGS